MSKAGISIKTLVQCVSLLASHWVSCSEETLSWDQQGALVALKSPGCESRCPQLCVCTDYLTCLGLLLTTTLLPCAGHFGERHSECGGCLANSFRPPSLLRMNFWGSWQADAKAKGSGRGHWVSGGGSRQAMAASENWEEGQNRGGRGWATLILPVSWELTIPKGRHTKSCISVTGALLFTSTSSLFLNPGKNKPILWDILHIRMSLHTSLQNPLLHNFLWSQPLCHAA